MSYILEALKKAQAERQLGALPTIHATTLDDVGTHAPASALKKPLVLALAALAVAVLVLLALLWKQAPQPERAAPAPAIPVAQAERPQPAPVVQPALPAATAPLADVLPPPALPPSAPPTQPSQPAQPATAPASAPAPTQAAAAPPAAAPVASKPADTAAADDALPLLRDLPEPIQRSVPAVAMGGYMYSKNPADRLVLIDKVLRHEGEEVAPGLVLEKLQPKAAVFSFKGYRYRQPY